MGSAQQEDQNVEEILSSIRNIISEDIRETKKGSRRPLNEPKLNISKDVSAVLELTNLVGNDGSITELTTEAFANSMNNGDRTSEFMPKTPKGSTAMKSKEDLISSETATRTQDAFSHLKKLSTDPSTITPSMPAIHSGNIGNQTFESIIHQMLQPMLKEWLDAHLPTIVKFLVSEQIEKILKNK